MSTEPAKPFTPTTQWTTDEPCPECGAPVVCTMGTHLMCTAEGCPFEMGSCSGRWVDATEYDREQAAAGKS